jgi:aspartate kinase
MFAALAAEKVNIKMITTGDIKITVLVDKADAIRALRAVHQAFRLHEARPGAGLNGSKQPMHASQKPAATERALSTLTQQLASMEDIVVSDVQLNMDQGRITIFDLPDRPGHCSHVFEVVAAGGIVVDLIVQNLTKTGRAELSFSVPRTDLDRALALTQKAARSIDPSTRVLGDPDIAKLYVLGVGMRTHTGVAKRMFGALARRGINISMINTSEVRISVVVDRARGEEALACLREAFMPGEPAA